MTIRLRIGLTYARSPIPTWPKERKGILERIGDGVVGLRDPSTGLSFTEATQDLQGPIDPVSPPAVCPVCKNTRRVPHVEPTDEPWVSLIVGTEPCPMCSEGADR